MPSVGARAGSCPFAGPYRPLWVGVGQLAFYLMVVVYVSFYLRRRIGQRGWRMLHYTTFLAFVGATAHGLMSGTDTPAPWAFWSYAARPPLVGFLLGYRITVALGDRRQSTASKGVKCHDFAIAEPCVDHMDQSCVAVCPADCISNEPGVDRKIHIDPDGCIECGSCVSVCPNDAIWQSEWPRAGFRLSSSRSTRRGIANGPGPAQMLASALPERA